jgi:hypothetical protein
MAIIVFHNVSNNGYSQQRDTVVEQTSLIGCSFLQRPEPYVRAANLSSLNILYKWKRLVLVS